MLAKSDEEESGKIDREQGRCWIKGCIHVTAFTILAQYL